MDIEVKIPDIGVDEVEITEILVKVNEKVELEQGLITVEGDKASMEIPSPTSGIIKNIHVKVGDKIKTSSLIMTLKVTDTISHIQQEKLNIPECKDNILNDYCNIQDPYNSKKNFFIHATPIIRRLARKLNINLCHVIGTGRKNRILKEDIELYQKSLVINEYKDRTKINVCDDNALKTQEIKLSSLQKIIGDNLHQNWINIPHVTQFDEVNITVLEAFRKKYNYENKIKKNITHNITILVFVIKVVACALEKFPIFNSSLDVNNQTIILKKYINIGIAVDVSDGLFVPVLKNVNKKNIQQLSNELIFISEKARNKKIHASDMKEGCFTISNLGGIGGTWFSPIINSPEVAILGVSKSQIKPLWNGKEFLPSLMLPLSLSYDHRVINGADAARFITFINKLLSDIHFLIM